MSADDTPRDPLAVEDIANLREVVESQARLGHPMTIVPNDVLLRVLDATRPSGDEALREAVRSGEFRAALDEQEAAAATRPSNEALRAAAVRRLTSFFGRGFDGVGYSYALETVEVIGNAIWDAALATPSSAPDVETCDDCGHPAAHHMAEFGCYCRCPERFADSRS